MIAIYYPRIDTKMALENCEFKTIAVCKGSCYVTKQIKIVSSETNKESQQSQQVDLSSLKDALGVEVSFNILPSSSFCNLIPTSTNQVGQYSHNHTFI